MGIERRGRLGGVGLLLRARLAALLGVLVALTSDVRLAGFERAIGRHVLRVVVGRAVADRERELRGMPAIVITYGGDRSVVLGLCPCEQRRIGGRFGLAVGGLCRLGRLCR